MPAPHTWLFTSFAPEVHRLPWPTSPHPRIRSVTEARQFSSAARVHPSPDHHCHQAPDTRSFHSVVCRLANALILSTLAPKWSFQHDRCTVSASCCTPFHVRPGFKILEASGLSGQPRPSPTGATLLRLLHTPYGGAFSVSSPS